MSRKRKYCLHTKMSSAANKTHSIWQCVSSVQKMQKSDDEVIEDLLFAILFNVKCEHSSPFDALEFINRFSVWLDVNKKNLPEFIRLYCALHNNTQNPFLNGFTPNEWLQRTRDKTDSRYLDPKDF